MQLLLNLQIVENSVNFKWVTVEIDTPRKCLYFKENVTAFFHLHYFKHILNDVKKTYNAINFCHKKTTTNNRPAQECVL